jgi:hypothetical protein
MTKTTYLERRQTALESLERGDAREAFGKFRWTMEYPGQLGNDPDRWRDALTLFARITTALVGEAFTALVRRVADAPDDVQALYDLGYGLIEQNLNGIAATVLARANLLVPNMEILVVGLACALERRLEFREACRFLQAVPELVEQSFQCGYALAYNTLMTGNLIEARQMLRGLDPGDDPDLTAMTDQIAEMLSRADAVRGVTPLNETDLRGWHFVLTGGMLMHLWSPAFEDGMHGRYAFTQDSPNRCLEGIRRLASVFQAWSVRPARVWLLPNPDSASLGFAAAQVLGLPGERWPAGGTTEPGLIVAYDLSTLDDTLVGQMREHRRGQLLWAHASCWMTEPPFAADLTTYLYQANESLWSERLRVKNLDMKQAESGRSAPLITAETVPADTRPPPDRAADIVAANLDAKALKDVPALVDLVQAARRVAGGTGLSAFRTEGLRRRQPVGSPVSSNFFL